MYTAKVFRKTGEYHDRYGNWDGDRGYYVDVDLKFNDLVNILQNLGVSKKEIDEAYDRDELDELAEEYRDEIDEYYSEEID